MLYINCNDASGGLFRSQPGEAHVAKKKYHEVRKLSLFFVSVSGPKHVHSCVEVRACNY